MNSSNEILQPSAADLEDTAKLPALIVAKLPEAGADEVRDQLEGNLRALTENLRTLEESLRVKAHELSVFKREVGEREQQIVELQSLLAGSQNLQAAASAANGGLQTELSSLQTRLTAAHAERDQHAAMRAKLEAERAAHELALARAGEHASQMQYRAENYLEVLQTSEAQRSVYDGMVAERELQLQHAQANAATQTEGVAAQLATTLQREQSLQADLQHSRGQTAELDRQLRDSQARGAALVQQLEKLRAEARQQAGQAVDQQQELKENVARLERGLRDHMEMIQAMQQQHNALLLKVESGAAELAAAEQRLLTMQNELHQRDVQIERLKGIETGLRQQLAQADDALAVRDALIVRLEGETASSAAVLGSIQHNLERMGSEPGRMAAAVPAGASGDTVMRLLVPASGEQRVVHLLGRRTSIGRTADNDLQINEDCISRHHAVILTSSTSAIIEDLKSTNGVIVNGKKMARQVLNDGDLVTIGQTTFRFVLKPAAERPSQDRRP